MGRLVVFTADKAGMVGVDKKKVNQVVYDMSKNSRHFKNAKRLDLASDKRVAEMKRIVEATKHVHSPALEKRIAARINELETTRDLSRIWVVIDMDMFFAAVEMRENPSLRGKPVAVGGMAMISTANYEARTYGVRSAMPGFIAVKLCPHLVFVGHSRELYKKVAEETRAIYRDYDASLTAMSLDEAYLDVTEYWRRNGDRYLAMAKQKPRPERCTTFGDPPRPQVPPTRGPGAPVHPAGVAHSGPGGAAGGSASAGAAAGAGSATAAAAAGTAPTPAPERATGAAAIDLPPAPSSVLSADSSDAHGFGAHSPYARSSDGPGAGCTAEQESDDEYDDFRASGFSFSQEVAAGLGEPTCDTGDEESDCDAEGGGDGAQGAAPGSGAGGSAPRGGNDLAGGVLPVNSTGSATAFHRDPVFEAGLQLMVQEIRDRVYEKTRLTCSAGIAPNPMLAKICSDKHKPDGQFLLPFARASIVEFVKDLPVRKVPGVGKVTEKMLSAIGCTTCGEAFAKRVLLARVFSQRTSDWMLRVSLGISNALRLPFAAAPKRKSMSTERTFREISDPGDQVRKCRELCEKLAGELQEKGLKGRTITLKIKHVDFRVFQRSQSRKRYVNSADALFETAVSLLRSFQPCRLRLMGVRVNNFQNKNVGVSERDASQAALDAFLVKAPQNPPAADSGSGAGAAAGVPPLAPSSTPVNQPASSSRSSGGGSSRRSHDSLPGSMRRRDSAASGATRGRASGTSTGQSQLALPASTRRAPAAAAAMGVPLVQCPVCGRQVCARNDALNRHVDACLRGEQPDAGPAWAEERGKRRLPTGARVPAAQMGSSKRRKSAASGASTGGKRSGSRDRKLPRGQRTLSFFTGAAGSG